MAESRIVDVTDADSFGLIPPCADPRFDHRTCDYWEDADRGSKASRPSWLEVRAPAARPADPLADNPFAPPARAESPNPFVPSPGAGLVDPFGAEGGDLFATPLD